MTLWTPKERLRWAFTALRDPRLKSADKVLAVFYEGYANSKGQFWVGKVTASRQLHISPKSVQRSAKNLNTFGYLRVRKRIGTTSVCTIQFPELEIDPGAGHVEAQSRDTVVPLTLYKPETKPSHSNSRLLVNGFSGSEFSNGLEKNGAVTAIEDFARRRELGKYEVELAERLGSDGYDILTSLPWPKLMYLLLKTSNGSIDDLDLSKARAHWLKKLMDPGGG
jgi:hypothetical protein